MLAELLDEQIRRTGIVQQLKASVVAHESNSWLHLIDC
jgi:hypothetical protein